MHQMKRVIKGCGEDVSTLCLENINQEMKTVVSTHLRFPRIDVAATAITCLAKPFEQASERCHAMVETLDFKTTREQHHRRQNLEVDGHQGDEKKKMPYKNLR